MSIEGITRVRRRGQVILPNETVYDDTLSYTALGVLAVLLARPDDAPKGYRTLMRPNAGVGQKSILSAFRELRAGGYRYQFLRTVSTPDGNKVYTDTYIYDSPATPEMAKQDHFESTGCMAIEVPDRRKGKGTLASLRDAHERDAHERDAHERAAQRTGSAGVTFSGSPKPVEQINQEPENEKTPKELPSQPTATPANDATKTPRPYLGITEEQKARNREGAAKARAALRAQLTSTEAKDGK
jgi:hypothetical protein